ncbi:MAG: RBBP9/YdeN family alpha/beta hydrolase [Brachymonas sp.]
MRDTDSPAFRVLTLPGWQGSGPEHWQSRWERLHGCVRVAQHDWQHPLRGDWMIQLEEAVLASPVPVVLAAHSLGCILVAAWAAHSQQVARVRAALLVAPGDVEQPALSFLHPSWRPISRQRLPFASVLVSSQDDPYCSPARAQELAQGWGSRWVDVGARGHINAESGLGDWPEGYAWLQWLMGQGQEPHPINKE